MKVQFDEANLTFEVMKIFKNNEVGLSNAAAPKHQKDLSP